MVTPYSASVIVRFSSLEPRPKLVELKTMPSWLPNIDSSSTGAVVVPCTVSLPSTVMVSSSPSWIVVPDCTTRMSPLSTV